MRTIHTVVVLVGRTSNRIQQNKLGGGVAVGHALFDVTCPCAFPVRPTLSRLFPSQGCSLLLAQSSSELVVTMFACRNAWQKLVPLTQRASASLLRNAPVRHMSAGSVPGSSGEYLPYYLAVGVAMIGGVSYAYYTVLNDRARNRERYEYIETQVKPKMASLDEGLTVETSEVHETAEEAVDVAIEEAAAEVVTEQKVAPTTPLEQEQPVTQQESISSPVEEEPAVSPEASTEQVEQVEENTETVVEVVAEETSPVLEASSDNIPEELASAADDFAELSARKPEESVEENSSEAQESEEAVEAEAAASS